MAWTTPRTWSSNEIVTAALLNTHVRDNEGFLISRVNSAVFRDNGGNYTTTSGTFADIDSTNLTITLTATTTKFLLRLICTTFNSAGSYNRFDFTVDSTRVGAAFSRGIVKAYSASTTEAVPVCVEVTVTVAAGSHTFRPQWSTEAGTASILGGAGNDDCPVIFEAIEVA